MIIWKALYRVDTRKTR